MNKLTHDNMLENKALSISMINTLFKCGEQFRRRYIMGDKIRPGIALIIGSSTHQSIEVDLNEKLETGKLAPIGLVEEIAAEQVKGRWDKGVALSDDEELLGEQTVRNNAINTTVALAKMHHELVAPGIEPIRIEDYFSLTINGTDWSIAGTSDIEEKVEGGVGLRDTKTAKKSPSKGTADDSRQLTMYALKVKVQTGDFPKHIQQDYLVKTKIPKYVVQETTRNEEDIKALKACISMAIKQIRAGIFPPCDSGSWVCSRQWCGYFSTCKYRARR